MKTPVLEISDMELIAKFLKTDSKTVFRAVSDDMVNPVEAIQKKLILQASKYLLENKKEYNLQTENNYLWAKIAEMEQRQLKYLIDITEPYNQTPAY